MGTHDLKNILVFELSGCKLALETEYVVLGSTIETRVIRD